MTLKKDGKTYNIPEAEIDKLMKKLKISNQEAVEVWLADKEYEVNEEQEELQKKASKVKIDRGTGRKVVEKEKKSRVPKVSDEKKVLFDTILTNLDRAEGVSKENIEVLRNNKLILVKIGKKKFKIDLIECRK